MDFFSINLAIIVNAVRNNSYDERLMPRERMRDVELEVRAPAEGESRLLLSLSQLTLLRARTFDRH